MPKQIYIAIGNHRSYVGIKEIIYSVQSALSDSLSVKLTRELKSNSVNIIIDEFSGLFDLTVIKKTKELYPNTKIVIVATEFATPASFFGLDLAKTFNFFGTRDDWAKLILGSLRPLAGGMPSYMQLRYLGFVRALQYCDLLTVIHPAILPTISQLVEQCGPRLAAPLPVYPQIGPLSIVQLNRLWHLPVGFTMTGTQTKYRIRITRNLVRKFERVGWFAPIYKHVPFEAPANDSTVSDSDEYLADYHSFAPEYLFNINPPQTSNWPYSSPMRILRAILLGQIPVVTKKFHDHILENVATLWDGKVETAVELGTRQFIDRRLWLTDYMQSLEAYDRQAREANEPFVNATKALAESIPSNASLSTAPEATPFATLSRASERR
jgi:hypothetical protein